MSNVITVGGAASQAEQEFQEKMKERMRQSFGDLMPDEVLAGIVARGIEEAFFKKQTRLSPSGWGGRIEEYPSWLVEFVEKEARRQTELAVQKWVKDNEDKFAEIVKDTIGKGLLSAVIGAVDHLFAESMNNFRDSVGSAIASLRERSY